MNMQFDTLGLAIALIVFQLIVIMPCHGLYYVYNMSLACDSKYIVPDTTPTLGTVAYIVAYPLTILRLPYALMPYLIKTLIWFVIGPKREKYWSYRFPQFLRTLGDWANLVVTTALLSALLDWIIGAADATPIISISLLVEYIRLMAEKGQMLFSAAWQLLPHRCFATTILTGRSSILHRHLRAYIQYYHLSDADRIAAVEMTIAEYAARHRSAHDKLRYFRGFKVVPNNHPLWSGNVRNVASGLVYIHASWTSEPWLLLGQALRRGSWVFDPRILPFDF